MDTAVLTLDTSLKMDRNLPERGTVSTRLPSSLKSHNLLQVFQLRLKTPMCKVLKETLQLELEPLN